MSEVDTGFIRYLKDTFEMMNKLGLFLVSGKKVNCPIIKECPISYECRVVNRNNVIPANLFPDISPEYYPQGDYHRVYFGEILTAYKRV